MGFDRSKIKRTKVSEIKQVTNKVDSKPGNSEKITYHSVKGEGTFLFRIAPAHGDGLAYQPFETSSLPCEVNVWKDGEKTDEMEIKEGKKVFTAKVHSPVNEDGEQFITKDPIYTYISYAWKQAFEVCGDGKDTKSKEARKEYMNKIISNYPLSDGKGWYFGINPNLQYMCYAWDKEGNFGILQLNGGQMKEIQRISLEKTPKDQPYSLDIFSDSEQGYYLKIVRYKLDGRIKSKIEAEEPSQAFLTEATKKLIKEGKEATEEEVMEAFFESTRLTDDQLVFWDKQTPLGDKFGEKYSENDFNLAIDGLRRFDERNDYNIFANDDFLDELEEINHMVEQLPKKEDGSEPDKKEEKSDAPEETQKPISTMEMKKFVKGYIAENYPNMELPADIKGAKLEEWYKLAQNDEVLPFEEGGDLPWDKEGEKPITQDLPKEQDGGSDIKSRLAKLKESM